MSGVDTQGVSFAHRWSFTTETGASITKVHRDVGTCGVSLNWTTVATTTTWVEYGPMSVLGQRAAARQRHDTIYAANVQGLQPATTYYYRVVAQDVTWPTITGSNHKGRATY